MKLEIGLNGNLEKDKTYSLYVDVKGDEGYGDSDPAECWSITFSGTVTVTKDTVVTENMLYNMLGQGSWVNYKFVSVEFKDVTELVTELESLKLEDKNFDWTNKPFEDWEVINDKINELEDKVSPCYFGCISINKTI